MCLSLLKAASVTSATSAKGEPVRHQGLPEAGMPCELTVRNHESLGPVWPAV